MQLLDVRLENFPKLAFCMHHSCFHGTKRYIKYLRDFSVFHLLEMYKNKNHAMLIVKLIDCLTYYLRGFVTINRFLDGFIIRFKLILGILVKAVDTVE